MTAKEKIKYDYLCMLRSADAWLKMYGKVDFYAECTDRLNSAWYDPLVYLCRAYNRGNGCNLRMECKPIDYCNVQTTPEIFARRDNKNAETLSEMLKSNKFIMISAVNPTPNRASYRHSGGDDGMGDMAIGAAIGLML